MNKQDMLDKLRAQILKDTSLPLRLTANNLVFGEGSPDAKIFLLGEGPGYWEDIKGRPFVGNAGKFLDQLLHSIKVKRSDVFITNVVCYRPPNNRDPLPNEIAAFQKYIDKMIEIINPKLIVTLGRFSMAKFIPGVKISQTHGKAYRVNFLGRMLIIVPMFHPAAGLRSLEIKRKTVEDFAKLGGLIEKVEEAKVQQMKFIL